MPAPTASAPQRRRRSSAGRRLYEVLRQQLHQHQDDDDNDDLPASWMQSYDDEYIGDQQPQLEPTLNQLRKRKTGRCYFHAINCW